MGLGIGRGLVLGSTEDLGTSHKSIKKFERSWLVLGQHYVAVWDVYWWGKLIRWVWYDLLRQCGQRMRYSPNAVVTECLMALALKIVLSQRAQCEVPYKEKRDSVIKVQQIRTVL